MDDNSAAKALVRVVVKAILETVQQAQKTGPVPSGHLYAALMGMGIPLHTYNALIDLMVEQGMLKRGPMHTLTAPQQTQA